MGKHFLYSHEGVILFFFHFVFFQSRPALFPTPALPFFHNRPLHQSHYGEWSVSVTVGNQLAQHGARAQTSGHGAGVPSGLWCR